MHLLYTFARAYPVQSAIMLVALLVAGLVEGFSLTALLPLLNRVLAKPDSSGEDVAAVEAGLGSGVGDSLLGALEALGFLPSVEMLLVIIVVGAIIKGGLVLLAKKRVGYIVAHVATDLRLSMLRAMLASRWEYFLHQPVGQLTNSMSIEAVRASTAYLHGATLISQAIQALVYVIIATMVMWQAALFSFLMGIFIYLALSRLVKMARRAGRRQTKFTKLMIGRLTDTLLSVKPLKSMGRERLVDTVLVSETKNINRALRREVVSAEILVAGQGVARSKKAAFEKAGARVIESSLKDNRIDMSALMDQLGELEICSLLIEGGSRVLASAFKAGIVDKVLFFYGPKILGGDDGVPICSGPGAELMNRSTAVKEIAVRRFADDILIEGYIEKT